MKIACLGENNENFMKEHELKVFNSIDDFFETSEKYDAIFLMSIDFVQNNLALKSIRRHEFFSLTPVFTTVSTDAIFLYDGIYQNEKQVTEIINHINQNLNEIKIMPVDERGQFLAYCYSRAPFSLSLKKNWQSPIYYHYPLTELFIEDVTHILIWFEELFEKDLLSRGELVHANFFCSYCESAHLIFSERCPNCHHENIKASPFLHCFTCGLIAPENEFLQEGRFKCPKCESLLRHIGEDYDRPLESGECSHCHTYYQEAELWVRCMLCERDYSPERLGKRNNYLYEVSEANARNILNIYFTPNLSVFDDLSYIDSTFFMALFNWLFSLNRRYEEETFSIVGIFFSLSSDSLPWIRPFAEQLKKILRKTDLLTRIKQEEIWILLPKTNKEGLDVVLARLKKINENFSSKLNWKIASICSTKIPKEMSAENVLVELRTGVL